MKLIVRCWYDEYGEDSAQTHQTNYSWEQADCIAEEWAEREWNEDPSDDFLGKFRTVIVELPETGARQSFEVIGEATVTWSAYPLGDTYPLESEETE